MNLLTPPWHRSKPRLSACRNPESAFTLVEVMIASGVFFIAMFGILGVMVQGLNGARLLKRDGPTAGMVASDIFAHAATNRVEETSDVGDFGDAYPGFKYAWETVIVTNGMYRLDVVVTRDGGVYSTLTTFLYDAKSAGMAPRKF